MGHEALIGYSGHRRRRLHNGGPQHVAHVAQRPAVHLVAGMARSVVRLHEIAVHDAR